MKTEDYLKAADILSRVSAAIDQHIAAHLSIGEIVEIRYKMLMERWCELL